MVDELFGDAVVQLGLPPSPGGGRTPFPYHRFAAGDMVALREGDAASLPFSRQRREEEEADEEEADEEAEEEEEEAEEEAAGSEEGSEGVVLQRTATSLLVVLRDPIDRLEFSYWYHVHYPKRCAGLELTGADLSLS